MACWTQLSTSESITMNSTVNIALAMTSGRSSDLASSSFDNVSIPNPILVASNCQDRRPSASNFGLRIWDQIISLGLSLGPKIPVLSAFSVGLAA
jgi:hypothetical protein